MAWLKKQNRGIALSAVRSEMRKLGLYPERQSSQTALHIIDEITRKDPETRAAKWYALATDNEICLFIKEWRAWCRETLRDYAAEARHGRNEAAHYIRSLDE